jgi:hypothetical protein
MSNTKHTPGPWRYIPNLIGAANGAQDDGYAYPYLIYAGSEFVAQVVTDQLCEKSCDEENARLIAAAPAMLEALQALVSGWPGSGAVINVRAAVFQKARAAIAAATGEAS